MAIQDELTDGDRLKHKFAEMKRDRGISKAAFARATKFPGGASMISQNIANHKPISLDGAHAYSEGFGCSVDEISPALAARLKLTRISTPPAETNAAENIGIRTPSNLPDVDAAVETIAQALEKMTEAERAAVMGKIGKLADAYDSAAVKKSIVQALRLAGSAQEAVKAFAQSGKKAA